MIYNRQRVKKLVKKLGRYNVLPAPYGLTLDTSFVSQPADTRDFVDANNQVQSARFIDPNTKDYKLNSTGHFVGENVIEQQVYLSLLTTFDSSAQSKLGNKFKNIRIITPNIKNQLISYVNEALKNLISTNSITVNSIDVISQNSQVSLTVKWTNNQTATKITTNILR